MPSSGDRFAELKKRIPFLVRFFEVLLRGPIWLAVYLLCVIAIAFAIARGLPPAPTLQASKNLEADHRITGADIKESTSKWLLGWSRFLGPNSISRSEVIGRYTTLAVPKDGSIEIAGTSAVRAQSFLLRISADTVGSGQVSIDDVGKDAQLCLDSSPVVCSPDVVVQGVSCSGADRRDCAVSVYAPISDRDAVLNIVRTAETSTNKRSLHVITMGKAQT